MGWGEPVFGTRSDARGFLDAARQLLSEPEMTLDLGKDRTPPSEVRRPASAVTCTGLPARGDGPGRNGASSAIAGANSVDRMDPV